jgi:hypothetical protein
MTTSYPPHNGGMHPQGLPPGHPMAAGGPNQGQHMPPGMHPGVSGPNGSVSQAGPMMGMQPGMGPNAHALSHLQPQQAQMFQQQQQQHPGMSKCRSRIPQSSANCGSSEPRNDATTGSTSAPSFNATPTIAGNDAAELRWHAGLPERHGRHDAAADAPL